MESLFFIPRYMGSDDDEEDGNQQVSTNKLNKDTSNSPGYNAAFASKQQQSHSAQESDSVMEIEDSNCSGSVESANCRSSHSNFVDSVTKSKKHKKIERSKSEKCLQNLKKEILQENVSKDINSYIEIDNEIQILDHCSNSVKNCTNNSFAISEKSSSKDKLKMFDISPVEIESEIEILNDSDCLGFIQNTHNKSSDFKEEISSCIEPLKKKRKQEENGLQNFNLSSFKDSKVINENSCSFIKDTTEMNKVIDLEPRRAKKMKKGEMENSEQNNKECKSDAVDLVNALVIDWKTTKNKKEKANHSRQTHKKSHKVKMFDNLNSSVEIESEIEILNDSDCLGFIQDTHNKSSDFKEEINSCIEPSKKKRKREENGQHNFNLLSFQDPKVINENSCSFVEDTTGISETTDLESRRAKKMKNREMKNSEQIQNSQECKSGVVDLINAEVTDQETTKNEKEKANEETPFPTIGQIQHQKDISCTKTLPYWLTNLIHIDLQKENTPITEFNELDSIFKNNLIESGIQYLFPVQSTVIPVLMKNYVSEHRLMYPPADVCVCAPTGCGKTLAFVLPIVQALKERVVPGIRALIVLPVSELAIQVYKVFKSVVRGTDLRVALLTGQKSFRDEQLGLIRFTSSKKALSLVDIIVTTPGRIRDHIYRTDCFCLKFLRYLVIDEADRMMEEIQRGWLKQIEEAVYKDTHSSNCVCSGRPTKRKKSTERTCAMDFLKIMEPLQKLLCSATLTHDPEQLHSLSLYRPKLFKASASNSEQTHIGHSIIPDKLTTLQVICVEGRKPMVICHLIKQHQFKRVLCFAESVERTHRLKLLLEAMGLEVREISSLMKAVQRKIALKQFACGRVNVLVCSDLLTRGIDITDVDCVISYDVPQCDKMYVHRIGRTARAGKSGIAITLLSEGETPHFKKILKLSGLEIPDTINIHSEDLKPLLKSYQSALPRVDAKLRSKKHERFNKKKWQKQKI